MKNPFLENFRPYIPDTANLRELTFLPLVIGTLLGIVFGASSLYLVLKTGLTVSASIPVAVIAITLFRLLSKVGLRDATILEANVMQTAGSALAKLGVPDGVPIVTRDMVARAKPDPDLFLAAIDRLGVQAADVFVVGDSVWDLLAARRAQTLGIGLLSGGYGTEELASAGAYRVYDDPAMLLSHLDEVGVRGD